VGIAVGTTTAELLPLQPDIHVLFRIYQQLSINEYCGFTGNSPG
jgi:hypothetical protein